MTTANVDGTRLIGKALAYASASALAPEFDRRSTIYSPLPLPYVRQAHHVMWVVYL